MAEEVKKFVVGFTRMDGIFRHAEVKEGTKLKALLMKFGYAETELAKAINDVRINGAEAEGGLDYELKKDDTVAVVPDAKSGK